ncbi:MAG: hypothetical protein NVSMB6_06840 [Burkholderiaceae bacterium]
MMLYQKRHGYTLPYCFLKLDCLFDDGTQIGVMTSLRIDSHIASTCGLRQEIIRQI